jgi:fatty acid desaturase
MRAYVQIDRIRELSKTNAPLAMASIVLAWAFIFGLIMVNQAYGNIFTTFIVVLLIGNQQHGLLIQMHDAAHRRLAQNRILNDVVGEIFCAWPLFFRMAAYRSRHRMHHDNSNTELDPDFRPERFPKSRQIAMRMLITDFFGLNTVAHFGELKRLKEQTSLGSKIARGIYYACAAALITKAGVWHLVLLYWLLPAFTWLKVILRLRAIADHTGVETNEHPFDTRTIIPSWFDILFLAPRNCSYHFGHHTYESVPWFNLKKLHQELMKDEEVAQKMRITHGFHRLLSELPVENAILVEAPQT